LCCVHLISSFRCAHIVSGRGDRITASR
jgi:hypothetical protein